MPVGRYTEAETEIIFYFEEYEAIRLLDYENLTQAEAAGYMEISRPTLTRVYESARNKIARAFTESLPIKIEGGKGIYSNLWYICSDCESKFNTIQDVSVTSCPLCKGSRIDKLNIATV